MKIQKFILILFILVIFSHIVSGKMFSIELFYNGSDMKLNDFMIKEGDMSIKYNGHQYNISLFDKDNNLLYFDSFDRPLDLSDADPSWFDENGKQIYFPNLEIPNNWSIGLNMPYFENAEYLKVERLNKTLLNARIRNYIPCNTDGECDYNENVMSCPEDCKAEITKKKIECISDGICFSECAGKDPDCVNASVIGGSLKLSYNVSKDSGEKIRENEQVIDTAKEKSFNKWTLLIGVLVITIIITIILVIFLLNRLKLHNSIES